MSTGGSKRGLDKDIPKPCPFKDITLELFCNSVDFPENDLRALNKEKRNLYDKYKLEADYDNFCSEHVARSTNLCNAIEEVKFPKQWGSDGVVQT
jgi:hypothetical protein